MKKEELEHFKIILIEWQQQLLQRADRLTVPPYLGQCHGPVITQRRKLRVDLEERLVLLERRRPLAETG